MTELIRRIWAEDEGQDIAEYALMLTVVLLLVLATVQLIGKNANNIFSKAANALN
jgi:Flp pilus assembly pilin Flp